VRAAHGAVVLGRQRHEAERAERVDRAAQFGEFVDVHDERVGDVRPFFAHVGLGEVLDEPHQRAVHEHAHHEVVVVAGELGLLHARGGAERDAERAQHAEPREDRVECRIVEKIAVADLRVVGLAHRLAKRRALGHLARLVHEPRERRERRRARAEQPQRDRVVGVFHAKEVDGAVERATRDLLGAHLEPHRQLEEVDKDAGHLLLERLAVHFRQPLHIVGRDRVEQLWIDRHEHGERRCHLLRRQFIHDGARPLHQRLDNLVLCFSFHGGLLCAHCLSLC